MFHLAFEVLPMEPRNLQPEDTHQANGTLSAPEEGVSFQRLPAPEQYLVSCADDDWSPSILREHRCSFLQICAYNLVWTTALIAFLALLLMAS